MNALFDELFGAFPRRFAAQVGNTLFRDDDIDIVFRVVDVRAHRDDGRNRAFFRDGRAGEDREIRIAGKVSGAADSVHHLATVEMRGVDVSEKVHFNRRVHANQTEAAHDARIVGNFLRAQNDFVFVKIEVFVDVLEAIVRNGQRATSDEGATPGVHELDDGVLNDFRVHAERRNFGVATEGGENGIGDVADTGLNREKFFRQATCTKLVCQEVANVFADFIGNGIAVLERRDVVVFVGVDDADNLGGIDLEPCRSDTVLNVG